jgi:hypothetical protein
VNRNRAGTGSYAVDKLLRQLSENACKMAESADGLVQFRTYHFRLLSSRFESGSLLVRAPVSPSLPRTSVPSRLSKRTPSARPSRIAYRTKTTAGSPTAAKWRARKVQALPRLQKSRPANGPAHVALCGYYLRRRIA